MKKGNLYVADFETTTDENDCRVWGWGLYDVVNDTTVVGHTINEFMQHVYKLPTSSTLYFHNLKFDGGFLEYFFFRNGFSHVHKKKLQNNEFKTLISDKLVYYSVNFKRKSKLFSFYDSYKIIPLSVGQMSKAFGIEQLKGEIDYEKPRPIGYQMTDKEKDYIINDVEIVGKSLRYFFEQDLNKMTQAGNAFFDFKNSMSKQSYERRFPKLSIDKLLRESYKGGFTYVNPKYRGKTVGEGLVLDVNSLYPYVMYNKKLPYGEPIRFDGKYEEDSLYNLYIQNFRCSFKLKPKHIPTIQLKQTLGFMETEYLESSNGEEVTLCLTNVDLQLFLDHYDIFNVDWFYGWKFKSTDKIFKDYIDKWVAIKNQATIDGNEGLRTIAKLMLNALYGRFAINPKVSSKYPVWDGTRVTYKKKEEPDRDPVYVAIASFITSYAREITIRSAQENYDRFIYADTDSLHLVGKELPNLWIDKVELGAWKLEYYFVRGRFLRAKAYIEELEDGTNHIACAGLPHRCHVAIGFNNFNKRLTIPKDKLIDGKSVAKLQHKSVIGGRILKRIDYKIKVC